MLCRGHTTTVTVFAPAKLNLFLKVLGKRLDGYHELETLMVSVGLYDTLVLTDEPAGALHLSCATAVSANRRRPLANSPRPVPTIWCCGRLNSCGKTTGTIRGARIELVKRIPLAAGLAGGSSDAAATLWGLNRLWKLGLSAPELAALGARLGSDIPFFLCSSPAAICRGRGEIVEPLPLPARFWFVVAHPRSGLSTADVYRGCRSLSDRLDRRGAGRAPVPRAAPGGGGSVSQRPAGTGRTVERRRDAPQNRVCPTAFAGHMMSGSGTSYFGLCRSRRQGVQLAARLKATRLGDVFVVSSRP